MATNLKIQAVDGISVGSLRGVVLPENPIGDKILALWLFLHFIGRKFNELADVEFWGGGPEGNRPNDERQAAWKARGLYQLDVGDNRYHDRDVGNPRAGSACEMVLRHLGVIEAAGPGVAGVFKRSHEWLLDSQKAKALAASGKVRPRRGGEISALQELGRCCEQNGTMGLLPFLEFALVANLNNATGILKRGGDKSLFYMVRELVKNGVSVWEMIGMALTHVDAFYRARTEAFLVRTPENAEDVPELRSYLVAGVDGKKYLGPHEDYFTARQVLRDLYACGKSMDDCVVWAERWLYEIEVIGAAEAVCGLAWESGTCHQTFFGNGVGVSVRSDDPRMARWILRQAGLAREIQVQALVDVHCVVVVGSTGNIAVLSRGLNMRAVGEELVRREPERWFFDHRIQACLNGGHMDRHTAATQIPVGVICALVRDQAIGPFLADEERRRGGGRGPGGGERRLPGERDDGRVKLKSAFDEAAQRGGKRGVAGRQESPFRSTMAMFGQPVTPEIEADLQAHEDTMAAVELLLGPPPSDE